MKISYNFQLEEQRAATAQYIRVCYTYINLYIRLYNINTLGIMQDIKRNILP